MFDPCLNIKAGSEILLTDYAAAVHVYGEGQTALRAALSAYNSGSFERGFRNGYVARYYARAQNAPAHRSAIPDRRPNEVNPYQADIGIFNVKETANASE
jgi:type IV secretion system protein VirB1